MNTLNFIVPRNNRQEWQLEILYKIHTRFILIIEHLARRDLPVIYEFECYATDLNIRNKNYKEVLARFYTEE